MLPTCDVQMIGLRVSMIGYWCGAANIAAVLVANLKRPCRNTRLWCTLMSRIYVTRVSRPFWLLECLIEPLGAGSRGVAVQRLAPNTRGLQPLLCPCSSIQLRRDINLNHTCTATAAFSMFHVLAPIVREPLHGPNAAPYPERVQLRVSGEHISGNAPSS